MEQGSITLLIAFAAGVASFFSPCLLPLLPVYLGFLAGSVLDGEGRPDRGRALANSVHFVAGFSLVFIFLGLLAAWFASFSAALRPYLQRAAGLTIVIFGLYLAGVFSPNLLRQEKRFNFRPGSAGPVSSLLLGVAFAAGWTPCIGPALGAILALAAAGTGGIGLLLAFSLGMALPFLLAALLLERVTALVDRVAAWLPRVQRVFGWLLVISGAAVFFGLLSVLSPF